MCGVVAWRVAAASPSPSAPVQAPYTPYIPTWFNGLHIPDAVLTFPRISTSISPSSYRTFCLCVCVSCCCGALPRPLPHPPTFRSCLLPSRFPFFFFFASHNPHHVLHSPTLSQTHLYNATFFCYIPFSCFFLRFPSPITPTYCFLHTFPSSHLSSVPVLSRPLLTILLYITVLIVPLSVTCLLLFLHSHLCCQPLPHIRFNSLPFSRHSPLSSTFCHSSTVTYLN